MATTKKRDTDVRIVPDNQADRDAKAAYEAAADAALADTRPRARNGRFTKRGVIAKITRR